MKLFNKLDFSKDTPYYLWTVFLCLVLTICSLHIPFFWDNVYLVSKMAHYYYENAFPSVVLPLELDSGHPPFYALYVAAMWSCFGQTLAASHWAVFPFLVGLGISYYHLADYFLPAKLVPYAMLLLLVEPSLLAQSLLGGVDIALVCLYLMALNGIFYRKRWLLMLSLCLMSVFSLRGIIAVGLLGTTEFLVKMLENSLTKGNSSKPLSSVLHRCFSVLQKITPAYLPSIFLVLTWLYYHHQVSGFWVSNPDSPWAADYGYVDLKGWFKNLVVVVWRLLDYGRIVLWSMAAFLLLQWLLKRKNRAIEEDTSSFNTQVFTSKLQSLFLFIFLPLIFYLPFITLRQTPILHRYFLPMILLVSILFVLLLGFIKNQKARNFAFVVAVMALLSGHFWVYPDRIAKGWDASLAYLPYFKLNDEATAYIEAKNISFEAVGSEFPAVNPRKFTHLKETDLRHFIDKDAYELTDFKYILQSNVMNDFSEQDLEALQSAKGDWRLEKEFRNGQVYIRLYELRK
ncbi:MAG: hypothetical protein AB8B69_07420 [Chitinophagales bacterium]